MIVVINADEWYPVYVLDADTDSYGKPIDIPEELFARYQAAEAAYNAVQEELRPFYEENDK